MKISSNTISNVFRSTPCDIETLELKGYKLIKEYFVDSSGLGSDSEPALTKSQFEIELKKDLIDIELTSKKAIYSYITNMGQFQVYIGIFQRTGEKKAVKVANNTLKITTAKGYKIRLHQTDIIEFDGKNYILDSGGWETRTTKERINQFLPNIFYIFQKDFEWYIQTPNATIKFFDGIKI